jgi:hypothetical protein
MALGWGANLPKLFKDPAPTERVDPTYGSYNPQGGPAEGYDAQGDKLVPSARETGDYSKYQKNNGKWGYGSESPGYSYSQNQYQPAVDAAAAQRSTQDTSFNDFLGLRTREYRLDQAARNAGMNRDRANTATQGLASDSQGAHLRSQFDLANRSDDLKLRATGIDRTQAANDLNAITGQRGVASEVLANQLAGYALNDKTNRRKIDSKAVAGGTWLTPGPREDLREAREGLGIQQEGANIGYRGKILDLDSRQKEVEGRQQKLDMVADEVGISRDKSREALDFGLKQLGYDRWINSNQLLDKIDSASVAERAALQKIMGDAVAQYQVIHGGAMGDEYKAMLETQLAGPG